MFLIVSKLSNLLVFESIFPHNGCLLRKEETLRLFFITIFSIVVQKHDREMEKKVHFYNLLVILSLWLRENR